MVSQRKQLGAWYTPSSVVDAVVAQVVPRRSLSGRTVRVLDPACGDGRFLAAAADLVRRRGGVPHLVGVDVDAGAISVARAALPDAELIHDDALRRDWGDRRFDLIVGNPPFLNQLAAATTRGGRSRFGGGPYADTAAEFLALAVELAAPGARIGLVLPQSLLATRDAAAIRSRVDEVAALRWMWWSDALLFDAAVRVWAGVWEVGGRRRAVRRRRSAELTVVPDAPAAGPWSRLIADVAPPPASTRTLGDVATCSVDFRDQYYGLVGAVSDDGDGPPLITSGLIDPGACHWGSRPVRFAKRQYLAPRVDLSALTPAMRRWAESRLVPKVLVANQTKVIEAVPDRDGAWLPGVPVITVTAPPEHLDLVMRVLASSDATAWVRYHAAGSGLGAGTIRLSPALLASIPIPAELDV